MPHTEQYHTVRCTLTKRHGSPKSAQCMAKVDQIGFGGAGWDGDGGWWEALAGTAMMSGEGGGGRRPAGARAMEARAEGMLVVVVVVVVVVGYSRERGSVAESFHRRNKI